MNAGNIAQERFLNFLNEKLKNEDDTTVWEFYSYLLEQAKNHKLDFSGYGSFEYQDDRAEAKKRNAAMPDPDAFRLPERKHRQLKQERIYSLQG
jgi:hypothetical protein